MNKLEILQKNICTKYHANFQPTDLNLKIGISKNIKNTREPIHGLRMYEEDGTSGWYIWSGEWSDDIDFFVPLHGTHLTEWAENVLPYLGLPQGWRFLISSEYEDVWEDKSILNT